MTLERLALRLRARLLAAPGSRFTVKPTCGACGRTTERRDFGREYCKACEAERAAVSMAWDAQRDADVGVNYNRQPPAEPMFGDDDAGRPFLPDDDTAEGR